MGTAGFLIVFALVFSIALLFKSRSKGASTSWNGTSRGTKWGNEFVGFFARSLGRRAGYFLVALIVPYFLIFAPRSRQGLSEYFKLLERPLWKRPWDFARSFHCFGCVLLDRVLQSYYDVPRFKAESIGLDNFLNIDGQGAVVVGAHVGGWDLATSYLRHYGFKSAFHMVMYTATQGRTVEELKSNEDENQRANIISVNESSSPIFKIREVLKFGDVVGFMADRPMGNNIELVPFLNGLAILDMTPFRLATLLEKNLIFSFGFKKSTKVYEMFASSKIDLDAHKTGCKALSYLSLACAYAEELENRLKLHPHQWFNLFPFFSEPPSEFAKTQFIEDLAASPTPALRKKSSISIEK
jgi:predicted LPLAT superfamily acyltransferase